MKKENRNDTEIVKDLIILLREGHSIESASRKLGISQQRARLIAYTLASTGLLKTVKLGGRCSCDSCPLRDYCILNPKNIAKRFLKKRK